MLVSRRRLLALTLSAALAGILPALAQPGPPAAETLTQSICRLIEGAATARGLPIPFLTRLIWQESSFRPGVTSRAGAQGVAQFMPGTARARGLADPFDPEQAIPAAAHLIADLKRQFGNLGLAAAAYNGGPARVAAWLAGRGGLPDETTDYVIRITGRLAGDWSADVKSGAASPATSDAPTTTCLQVVADLRTRRGGGASVIAEGAIAPWGVQLAGGFSKAAALAAYERNRGGLASVLADLRPMILGSRLRYRGARTFYRVRLPARTRAEANALCARIRTAKGACAVLKT